MLQEALQKLLKESTDNAKSEYIPALAGEFMKYVRENPNQAHHFLTEGKSIKGSFEYLREASRKSGKSMVMPDKAKAIMLEYYGIKQDKPTPEPAAVGLNVDLDELLL